MMVKTGEPNICLEINDHITRNQSQALYMISNFRPVLNVVRFLLGISPASEFYMPTFRNALFHLQRRIGVKNDWV